METQMPDGLPEEPKTNSEEHYLPTVIDGHLVYGDQKISLTNGFAELSPGEMSQVKISQLPKDVSLRIERTTPQINPLLRFKWIELSWGENEETLSLVAVNDKSSVCGHLLDERWEDMLCFAEKYALEWDPIMVTSVENVDGNLQHRVTILFEGETIEELEDYAFHMIFKIEEYASAFQKAAEQVSQQIEKNW